MCDRIWISICSVLMISLAGAVPAALAGECQGASNPGPADAGFVCPLYDGNNVYVFLEYDPSPCATGFLDKAYFSDNKADVDNRNEDRHLGTVPPGWPGVMPFEFVVGYDDPGVPEYARAPLILGKTYYWCIDSWDGENYILGPTWSFTPWGEKARNPSPEDGRELVPHEGTMTWSRGNVDTEGYTVSYDIYIGTDYNDVNDAAGAAPEYMANVGTESYDYHVYTDGPHFWRVDTVLRLNRPPFTETCYTGNVWTFFPIRIRCISCKPDFYTDGIINFKDFALFAADWHKSGPGLQMDITKNHKVNYNDLREIIGFWLWEEP